jgi:bacterioferritin
MQLNKIIDKLNEILRHEWTGVAQYAQASFVIQGIWREVYADKFSDSAKESFKHAQLIGEKIVALGGVPTIERNKVQQSQDVHELLEIGLAFESKAVDLYTEALELATDDRALCIFLEDILLEEQEGVDELTMLLRDRLKLPTSSRAPGVKAG